jgi:hypothetical protein
MTHLERRDAFTLACVRRGPGRGARQPARGVRDKEAQEAIEKHSTSGPRSIDFDAILARLRDARGLRL